MNCIDKTELEQFLNGKLPPERLLVVDDHVRDCAECRAALNMMPSRKALGMELGATLLGAANCPEYEELSAFVDNSLESDKAKALEAHANMCEFCARDIDSIREMRSHASLIDTVTVTPGANRARNSTGFLWKRLLAAASVTAAIVAAALTLGPFGQAPVHVVATKPHAPGTTPTHMVPTQPVNTVAVNPKPHTPATPVRVALLKDGAYQVIEVGGKMILADSKGNPVSTSPVSEKLRTGKVKSERPVLMAMATLGEPLRGGSYTPSPSAPKIVSPIAKVMMTDKPTFAWSKVELAESYRLSIFTTDGTPVLTETVDNNSITLARPLARGKVYMWRVGAKFGESDQWVESAPVKFFIISNSDYANIQMAKHRLPGSHLALGAAYERAGLTSEAAREYRALRMQNPNSNLTRRLLR